VIAGAERSGRPRSSSPGASWSAAWNSRPCRDLSAWPGRFCARQAPRQNRLPALTLLTRTGQPRATYREGPPDALPACQHENPAGQKFCGECGARLAALCPSCRASNPAGQKFCGECGTVLGQGAIAGRFAAPEAYTPKHLAERILTSNAALEAERKQVMVLFADLKGSGAHGGAPSRGGGARPGRSATRTGSRGSPTSW
jgi:hypothetical protein